MQFDLRAFLEQNGVEKIHSVGATSFMACCPNPAHDDHNPSWAIYTTPPYSSKCFSCGFGGTLKQLKRELGWEGRIPGEDDPLEIESKAETAQLRSRLSKIDGASSVAKTRVRLPKGFIPLLESPAKDRACAYLKSRGVLQEVLTHINAYRMGTSPELPNALVMPIYEDGLCVYWTARSWDNAIPKAKRFLNPTKRDDTYGKSDFLYMPYLPQPEVRECFLVEGQFDAIKLMSFGYNAACSFNASPSSRQLRKLARLFDSITVVFDNDEAGINGADRVLTRLHDFGLKAYGMFPTRAEDAGAYEKREDFKEDLLTRKLF